VRQRGGRAAATSSRGAALAFGLFTAVLLLVPVEMVLRARARSTPYRVLAANARAEFQPGPGLMPGIEGVSVYSTTADGIRGRSYREDNPVNVLAIGGSTTECLYLDDAETWPALLEDELSRGHPERPVWVGNIGVSGHGAVEHIHHVRYYVSQLRVDAIVVMLGVNDLLPLLRDPEGYSADSEDPERFGRFMDNSFHLRPLWDPEVPRSFPANLAIWELGRRGYHVAKRWWKSNLGDDSILVEDRAGESYVARRRAWLNAPRLDTLPDLGPALERFERNVRELVATAKAQGVAVVLVTQPFIWHASLSPEAERLLWMAYRGDKRRPDGRYSPAVLERAMRAFNDRTRAVCADSAATCVDLAREMAGPEREAYFYDGVHLNERGSRVASTLLAAGLHRRLPGKTDGERGGEFDP